MSKADEISKWKKLLDEGSITNEEFERQKEAILSSKTSQTPSLNQLLIGLAGILVIVFLIFNNQDSQEISEEILNIEEIEEPEPLEEVSQNTKLIINNIEDISSGVLQIEVEGNYAEFDDDFNLISVESYSLGSGFLVSSNGYIVTNNHVIAGASIVRAYFNDSDDGIIAEVVAQSECSDLALLKIDRDNLPYFEWSNSTPKVGDEIYAAGYPLGNPEFTLLDGIVTKEEADGNTPWSSIESTFEHNAEIKTGNSGGPLIRKSDFKVVGVNYAVDFDGQEFAINNDLSQRIINSMIGGTNKPGFGINGEQVEGLGIVLYSVDIGSPLDSAGVKGGDIIVSIDGIDLSEKATLQSYCDVLGTKTSSGNVSIEVLRIENLTFYAGSLNSGSEIYPELELLETEESSTASASPTTTKPTTNQACELHMTLHAYSCNLIFRI